MGFIYGCFGVGRGVWIRFKGLQIGNSLSLSGLSGTLRGILYWGKMEIEIKIEIERDKKANGYS